MVADLLKGVVWLKPLNRRRVGTLQEQNVAQVHPPTGVYSCRGAGEW